MKKIWQISLFVAFIGGLASCSKDYNGPIDPVTGLPVPTNRDSEDNTTNNTEGTGGITDGGESSDWYGGQDSKRKKKP